MKPGFAADYIATISAVLHGSITPDEILDMSLARGNQLRMCWFIDHGYEIERA